MNVIIITQDDPFYLGKEIDYLLNQLPKGITVKAAVVSSVSPFGKRESLLRKALKTYNVFGARFFMRYSLKFIGSKVGNKFRVKDVLDRHSVDILELESSINSQESLSLLKSYDPDLLISIAGNEIFRRPLIDLAPQGCLNLHTALLPKYRGLMPSFWALANNESKSGVSVFYVDEGIDSGPIIVQKEFSNEDMTLDEVIQYSKRLGMNAIVEAVNDIVNDRVKLIENPDSEKSYYSFPTRADVKQFLANGKKFY